MSLLPQQIPPQTALLGKVEIGADGRPTGNVIIDINWWLFLFNIGKQVLSGPTAPIPLPAAVSIALSDDDLSDVDALQDRQAIASATALSWLGPV